VASHFAPLIKEFAHAIAERGAVRNDRGCGTTEPPPDAPGSDRLGIGSRAGSGLASAHDTKETPCRL